MLRFLPALLCLSVGTALAHEHSTLGAHEHGVADLNVAIEDSQLLIQIEMPAFNLLGFERSPRNDEEKQRLHDTREAVDDPLHWLPLPRVAACSLAEKNTDRPFWRGLEEPEASGHADIHLTYRFHCEHPEAIERLSFKALFTRFPGNESLKTQVIYPNGQFFVTLTPAHPDFALK